MRYVELSGISKDKFRHAPTPPIDEKNIGDADLEAPGG